MRPYTTDTTQEAELVQLECFRRMTPAQRIAKMSNLSTTLRRMAMDAIRRRYPDYSDLEVRLKFIELTYGKELGDAVRCFQQERDVVTER